MHYVTLPGWATRRDLIGCRKPAAYDGGPLNAFGTLKSWMGATHFLTKTLPSVRTELSLHVLAYNPRRVVNIFGTRPLIQASTLRAGCATPAGG